MPSEIGRECGPDRLRGNYFTGGSAHYRGWGLKLVLALLLVTAGCGREQGNGARTTMSITEILGGNQTAGYKQVSGPRPFRFPADHGKHPGYKNEWWYFTGNLTAGNGRKFGFQFTLFRDAVAPGAPASGSAWATNQVYLAQVALSDLDKGKYHSDERFGRGALGLAGVSVEPFHAWLDDWTVTADTEARSGRFAVMLRVAAAGFKLRLHLINTKPVVLQGDRGFSRKSPSPGNASYYYSYPRMDASGVVEANGKHYHVGGLAWYDHEWSTSSLQADQSGWDWFSLQMSNQWDLMIFRMRNRSDPSHDYFYGSLIDPAGGVESLRKNAIRLHVLSTWKSTASNVIYPARWQLDIPGKRLSLTITPRMANQEMNRSLRYWEGAISATGKSAGGRIAGSGYMELTGY